MSIPESLLLKLCCLKSKKHKLLIDSKKKLISSFDSKISYNVYDGIPNMVGENLGPENEDWNNWDDSEVQKIGDSYYKRAKGELPEKESSKSYARLLKNKKLYQKGNHILDIGCATGHFLKSFRRIIDPEILYTGIDTHAPFLKGGKEIFGVSESCNFVRCDALNLPFFNQSFDITIVNLFHFFPNILEALNESIRVTKNFLVWRTPIGEVNYSIKIIYDQSFDKIGVITPERKDFHYSLTQLYSKKYINELVKSLGKKIAFIKQDLDFEPFDNNQTEGFESVPATRTHGKLQINGSVLLDWHYVVIDCS